MAKNNNLSDFLESTADKLRSKLGTTDKINPQDFDTKIDDIYAAGKQAQYDAFWDAYQRNGGMCYWGAYQFFGQWWNDSNFYPKYDIYPGGGDSRSTFQFNAVSNLRERIDGRGLKVILPAGQILTQWFRGASTTEVPSMDTSNVTQFSEMFYRAANLVTVPRLNLTNATNLTDTFKGATSLANITFEGTIKISLDLSDCPLTADSVNSILDHLDMEEYTGTRTLTLKTTSRDAYQEKYGSTYEDEWGYRTAVLTGMGNWTFALV